MDVQATGEAFRPQREMSALQNIKFLNFFSIFVGHFCRPRSGFRIRIHWPDLIRILNTVRQSVVLINEHGVRHLEDIICSPCLVIMFHTKYSFVLNHIPVHSFTLFVLMVRFIFQTVASIRVPPVNSGALQRGILPNCLPDPVRHGQRSGLPLESVVTHKHTLVS